MKSHVSVEKKLCPICGAIHDTGILLDTRLRDSLESSTLTGYEICPEDQQKLDNGYIALIGAVDENSNKSKLQLEEANRTGDIVWLRRTVAEQIINVDLENLPFVFCDPQVVEYFKNLKVSED